MSCVPSEDNNAKVDAVPTVFKFSDMKYFMNFQTITTDQRLTSGYFARVDSANRFSFGFHCEMQKLNAKKASGVTVKTRYYYPGEGDASVVCTISKKDSVLYWEAMQLNPKNGLKKWVDVEKVFDFKKTYSADEMLTVYVWSPKGLVAYIEELAVTPKE